MGLQEINFVAEIIAALAIVGSLNFVGFQLRQNTAALSATAAQRLYLNASPRFLHSPAFFQ